MDGGETDNQSAKLLDKVRGILEEAPALKAALTRQTEEIPEPEEEKAPSPTP